MSEYVIAKYIRLSLDDARTDSMSIENQRLILDKHIAGLKIPDAEVIERVDNGFSGTNFERPGVQDLLELIREGRVNCVCVKDFSRFGRNAIETGYFIERVFPLFRVRFISVADNFDSAEHEGDTGGMEVAFKFLMHEYYSIDLSKKIKSAKREKQRRGESVTKNCLFGYKLDENRKMVIDEPAADTVRLIFALARDGKSLSDIQRALYDKKRMTPGGYKGHKNASAVPFVWEKTAVLSVLRDEQYIGTYIAGKMRSDGVGSKKAVKAPEGEWVKIPDHHPAIVDETTFRAVRERQKPPPRRKREIGTNVRYGNPASPLKSKVFCGCCGHQMRISSTANPKFHCDHTRIAPDAECHRLGVGSADLENAVFGTIQKQTQAATNIGGVAELAADDARQGAMTEHGRKIDRLGDEKRGLYEKLILGEVTPEDYKIAKSEIDGEIARLASANAALTARRAEKMKAEKSKELAAEIKASDSLTKRLADLLIDRVSVFPGGKIEIQWKQGCFSDNAKERVDYAQ